MKTVTQGGKTPWRLVNELFLVQVVRLKQGACVQISYNIHCLDILEARHNISRVVTLLGFGGAFNMMFCSYGYFCAISEISSFRGRTDDVTLK